MYNFRIRFHIAPNRTFNQPTAAVDIAVPGAATNYTLHTPGQRKLIAESSKLILAGCGFATEEDAQSAGLKAKDALAFAGAYTGTGIDLGNDQASGGCTEAGRRQILEKSGTRSLNDVHGLMVYDDSLPTSFASASGTVSLGVPLDPFIDTFQSAVTDPRFPLDYRRKLALQLYGLSHFESSAHAQFLLLVMVVEVLAEQRPRSDEAIQHVKHLIKQTEEAGLPQSDVDSLLGSIRRLKEESISAAGRRYVDGYALAGNYGGKRAKAFFSDCYTCRSKMLHKGELPENFSGQFDRMTHELDRLLMDILKAEAATVSD